MRNNDTIDQLKKEIEKLTIRIEILELERNQRDIERSNQQETPRNAPNSASFSTTQPVRGFRVGDRVRVTNNYRGQRGLEGTIVSITQHWIHFETENLGVSKRSPANLRRIN